MKITAAILSFVSLVAAAVFFFCVKTGYSFSHDISKHGIKLSKDYDLSYDKTEKTPDVIITALKKGEDYTVEYKNNKKIGLAEVTVRGKRKYTGEKTLKFEIVPEKCGHFYAPLITTDYVKLRWDPSEGADRYFIYVYISGNKWKKIDTVFDSAEYTVKDLEAGKTYKFRVRPAAEVDGEVYSGVSTSLTVTTGS